MRKLLECALAAGLCVQVAVAQTAAQSVTAPVAGIVLNGQGRLVAVRGVLANLMPGTPLALPEEMNDRAVLGAAFFGAIGAIAIEGEVLVVDATGSVQSRVVTPGGALFAFDPTGASLRWIYSAQSKTLQQVAGGVVLDGAAWGDAVVALGVADGGASLAVLTRSGAQLWSESVSTATGAIMSRVPISGAAPGLFFEGGWLVKADGGLSWQAESGAEPARLVALPGIVQSLQTAGLHAAAVNGQWLVNGNWQVVEIPANPAGPLLRRRTLAEPRP